MAHMSFTGRLLVATPLIGDPHFERSVVLLLTHNDDGAFGLVLNRPTETPVGGLASVDLGRPPTGEAVPWSELRLFAGSAGWAVGQLEDELREGAWWLVPAEPNEVLTDDPAGLWRRVLRRQPGATGWFANCPLDPSAN